MQWALAEVWMRGCWGTAEALREMGERGRRGVEARYSVEAMKERFVELAEKVLAGVESRTERALVS